tara:strand:- start:2240 stop:2623 length:384 start_codon:yes stop_codon:yes gene_type:complete
MVAKIATGEEEETSYVSQNRRKSGIAGAKARMKNTSAQDRSEIATKAATARWKSQEATMNEHVNACGAVAARYAKKLEDGLVDVKFLFQNKEEATLELACEELEALHVAITEGRSTDLNFGDLAWKE